MNFTLDIKKWRCAGFRDGDNLGKGPIRLLNDEGYMCCLGQFTQQIYPRLPIIGLETPSSTRKKIKGLTTTINGHIVDTKFSVRAVDINDNTRLTVQEKIRRLRALCKKHGHTLKVKNLKDVYNN